MKRIVFGITSLTLGGAERVLIDIVNELSHKYDITIFTLYGNGELEKEVPFNVKLVKMFQKSYNELNKLEKLKISLSLILNRKSIYKKHIENNFDVEIAFLEGPITRLFSVKNEKAKKIAWVHNDISKVFGKGIKSKIKLKLDKKNYSKYSNIVFVSEDNKMNFEDIYNIDIEKTVVFNYISENRILEKAETEFENCFDKKVINFLTVARLTEQKALDRLIKAHAKLIEENHIHNFYIIGDGPEKNSLINLIKEYNVENTFKLLGARENPYPYIKNCDVFALLSYYEGLPITLLEAKILKKPILITDTASREAVLGYNKVCITENTDEGVYNGIIKTVKLLENLEKSEDINNDNKYIIEQIEKLVN